MRIILLHDVAKIGRRYAVVEVPDGFARNKLIPTKAAVPATPDNLKRYSAITNHATEAKHMSDESLERSLKLLKETTITVSGKANAQGHLYQAITKDDIVTAAAKAGASLPVNVIQVASPLKTVGTHSITIVSGAMQGNVTIEVVAE